MKNSIVFYFYFASFTLITIVFLDFNFFCFLRFFPMSGGRFFWSSTNY